MKRCLQILLLLPAFLVMGKFVNAQERPKVLQRIILVGDAGEVHNGVNPVIDAVKRTFDMNDTANTVLFLGDNVYPRGIPSTLDKSYPKAKEIIDYQVSLLKDAKAKGIFIPGNHDWQKSKPDGWKQIRRQQQYIDSLHLPNVDFQPKDGCPGPVPYMIGNDILLIIVDTEWWLFPYEKPSGINSSCDCKTGEDLLTEIGDIKARYPHKLLIFAAHHPFRSYGIHGGYYTVKQHIFPFTDLAPYLYIPLPVLGSVYPITRGVFGTKEDLPNPLYQKMVKGVEKELRSDLPTLYVSGHDHSLQLIHDDGNYYVVSGSGSKLDRVKKGKKSEFATTQLGFTALEQLEDGTFRVRYFAANGDSLLFAKDLYQLLDEIPVHSSLENYTVVKGNVNLAADTQYYPVKNFYRFLLGENYRETWATPISVPVFNLNETLGGMQVLKRGGGKQTRSLRLADKNGVEYVLRSMKKYPSAAIPEELRETIAKDVVQDQISAAQPYAPTVVASLAEAAGVPHTNPKYVYLPRDTALGIYRDDFGDGMYLFEEREPMGDGKTYNTLKTVEAIQGDNDNLVNQVAVLKARLFDMYIGDWDRHDDQWRWYKEKEKIKKKEKVDIYYPVPRDRDQAFFVNEGMLPRLASRKWLMPKFQGFRPYFKDINGFNFNARYFDRTFLNGLSEKQWKEQSEILVNNMTDEVIHQAMLQFPAPIQAIDTPNIAEKLRSRRPLLEEAAMKYYRFLAKSVDVVGTNKDENFDIERLPGGKLSVIVRKISKKDNVQQKIYSRVFDPKDTKEVIVYGLGGEDVFNIHGENHCPIKVRIIGGKEKDTYIDNSQNAYSKRVLVYDLKPSIDSFALRNKAKLRLSKSEDNIDYNRMAFQYDKLMPLVTAGYNLDDGVSLGLGLQYTNHGFRKDPFKSKHTFIASHALATKAYNFKYDGIFIHLLGKNDLLIHANARAPHNTINFFGFGNETVYDQHISDPAIRYYRARYNYYSFHALMRRNIGKHLSLSLGPIFENYALDKDENDDRYISHFSENGLDSMSIYKNKFYTGGRLVAEIDTRDNDLYATRGFHWVTSLQGNIGLNDFSKNLTQLRSDMSIYMSVSDPAKLVFIARFGAGKNWGTTEYFQAMSLGGNTYLRGYRNYRFAGESMLYNNLELRFKLFDFTTYVLPGSVGLIAFNDVGRVWYDDDNSKKWHNGFGGGVYVTPINLLVISAVVGHSSESTLPYVKVGFRF